MKLSAELLLYCVPDSISLQLTSEGSIYYTVRKNDISIYLDYFLVDEFDGKDEGIVSIFKKDEKLPDFSGALDEAVLHLSEVWLQNLLHFQRLPSMSYPQEIHPPPTINGSMSHVRSLSA